MSQINIRIQGLPADVAQVSRQLSDAFEVLEISRDYANKNSLFVRRYVTVQLVATYPCGSCGEILPATALKKCIFCSNWTCAADQCDFDDGSGFICQRCADRL